MAIKNHLRHPRISLRNAIKHVTFSIQVGLKKWTIFSKIVIVCNDAERRRRKLHAFNKKNSFILLSMHILFFILPNFFVTLFMITCYLSLYLFLSHFSYLFSTNLLFSLQNLFFRIFVHFFPLSSSFSLGVFSCKYYASTHLFYFLEFKIINYSFKMGDFFSLCIFF